MSTRVRALSHLVIAAIAFTAFAFAPPYRIVSAAKGENSLRVHVTGLPDTITTGDTLHYSIVIKNVGKVGLVTVAHLSFPVPVSSLDGDPIPSSGTLIPEGCNYGSCLYTWVGFLEGKSSATISVSAHAGPPTDGPVEIVNALAYSPDPYAVGMSQRFITITP